MGKRQTAVAAAAAAAAEEAAREQSHEPEKKRTGGTAKFKKGSKVLVPHTDQYYAAVVMQGQKRPDGQWYLLHYEGWSSRYNEWVEEAGVVRYDRALLEQSAAAAGNEPGDLTGRRRRADIAPAEPQLAVEIPQQLRLHIPPLLKKVVLDDSTQVNINGKLLPLPRSAHGRPTVNDILKIAETVREMVRGVRHYFDQGLRHFLLYSHELQHADHALSSSSSDATGSGAETAPLPKEDGSSGKPGLRPCPCDLYGAEHLVRLLVKLPELVPVAYMTPPDVVRLEQQLHDLMARMTEVKRQARYFSLPEEYKPNPHFNTILAMAAQTLLGTAGGTAAGTGAPANDSVTGGGIPAAPNAGHNSEAVPMEFHD